MYSAPCQWYAGGPIGRIRFYEVPATNGQQFEPSIFWPWTESERSCYNTDQPGQRAGRTTYDLGTNFRPDLTGRHVDGTPADFLGAPLPAVIVPPECSVAPGLRLPIQFRAASTRSIAEFYGWQNRVRFCRDEAAECYVLWLRPDVFVSPADHAQIPIWADSSAARDNFSNSTGPYPEYESLASLGLYIPPPNWFIAEFLDGAYLQSVTPIVIGSECTIYLVAYPNTFVGDTLQLTQARSYPSNGLVVLNTTLIYTDTLNSVSATVTVPQIPLIIYEVRRGNGVIELRANGQVLISVANDAAGTLTLNYLCCISTHEAYVAEVIVSRCYVTDAEDTTIIQYLATKYQIDLSPPTTPTYYAPSYYSRAYYTDSYY